MNEQPVLIIAPPGPLRTGLQVLLSASPHLAQIHLADDGRAALGMLAGCSPSVIILDFRLPDSAALLRQLKAGRPFARTAALAHNAGQRQLAEAAGAQVVLRLGLPADQLLETVQQLAAVKLETKAGSNSNIDVV